MTIIRRFECALAPTKQKVVEQFKANPNFPAKAMYRISGFQFYNTSEFDLAELVNDADHIAANFKSYRNEEFIYREYTVMQPLQRSYAITEERIQVMVSKGALDSLYNEVKFADLKSSLLSPARTETILILTIRAKQSAT